MNSVSLFRLFGIRFTASWSWVFMLVFVVYAAQATFELLLPDSSSSWLWLLAMLAALLLVLSLYAHELGHALVAQRYGIPVRRISLFLLGGLAHIVRDSPSPRAELLIAVAGPVVSLGVGAIGLAGGIVTQNAYPAVSAMGFWLALTNMPLAIFNMLPAYPLDGGRVLRALAWFAAEDLRWASGIATRAGQVGAAALLFAGLYGLFTGTTTGFSGLWLMVVAWFVYAGALSAERASSFTDRLRGYTVAAIMERNIQRVPSGISLQAFAEEYVLQASEPRPSAFAVYRDHDLIGVLRLEDVRKIPVSQWGRICVERVAVPLGTVPQVEPGTLALNAFQRMLEDEHELFVVVAEDRLLGFFSRGDAYRAAERSRA